MQVQENRISNNCRGECCQLTFSEELKRTVAVLAFEDAVNCPVSELGPTGREAPCMSEEWQAVLGDRSSRVKRPSRNPWLDCVSR
ncbi:hypothetical protein CASFOL_028280 [Castilleja foliolosa]|uniref:Uncharacterized protein n=1 Tax=Castilleja foliolosa TaxID=1961234 RepID=A0ABD3CGG9_9LAMI